MGTIGGKYRLIASLGRGGMADVYLAVAQGLSGVTKLVVIKELRAELADSPEFVAMFLDEARLTDDGFFDSTARFVGALRDRHDSWATGPWTEWDRR